MSQDTLHHTIDALANNLSLIISEQVDLAKKIDFKQVNALLPYITGANRIFVIGAGRSGLAMQSAAMRLMHLGLSVYVVGETTTPAIAKGDLLLAASGSGTTSSIVRAAEKAVQAGASVAAFSTSNQSPLANLSVLVVVLPAAQKQDQSQVLSAQYAGSLFEQAVLLINDAIFQTLWTASGTPAGELWKRHANLE